MCIYAVISHLNKLSCLLNIFLSAFRLTEKMNKVYDDKKINKKKIGWKINDLCAVFIKKYGNWYRGKIINIDVTKQMVTNVTVSLNLFLHC